MNQLERILDKCVRTGAHMAEVYSLTQQHLGIIVRNGQVETISRATPGGIAIRYYKSGKSSFAFSTDESDAAVDTLIARLSSLAAKSGEDEGAILPEQSEDAHNLDLYAPAHTEQSTDAKIDYLVSLEQKALHYDPSVKSSSGMYYDETITTVAIANTNDLNKNYKSTLYDVTVNVAAERNNDMFPGEEKFSARYFEDLPAPEKMVEITAGRAVRLVNGRAVESGDYEIIFAPSAAGSIIWGLNYALNGDTYFKGGSFLSGRDGQKIADARLSVYDNAIMPRGIGTRPFDDEGVSSSNTALIENGVLLNQLYDLKTAAKAGKKTTGSAVRNDYAGFPAIGTSNLYIAAGKDKAADMLKSCRKGIWVEATQGWGLNGVTGQYSAGINGSLILNGKIIKSVGNVTLAGSVDELFNGIIGIGDDLSFYREINAPSIMVKKMRIGS